MINQSSLFHANWPKWHEFFYIMLLIVQVTGAWLLWHPIPAPKGWRRILPEIPELLQLLTRSALGLPRKSPELPVLPHSNMQRMEEKNPSFFQSCVRAEFSVQSSVSNELRGFRTEQGEFMCSSWEKLWSLSQNLLQTSPGQLFLFHLGLMGLE